MRRSLVLSALLAVLLITPACYTFKHQVGNGGTGATTESEAAWFILWGLIPLTQPDSHQMAGGASDYTATTEFTVLDVVISFFTGWVTIYKQTVTVEK